MIKVKKAILTSLLLLLVTSSLLFDSAFASSGSGDSRWGQFIPHRAALPSENGSLTTRVVQIHIPDQLPYLLGLRISTTPPAEYLMVTPISPQVKVRKGKTS